jgi:hypothetical protein
VSGALQSYQRVRHRQRPVHDRAQELIAERAVGAVADER